MEDSLFIKDLIDYICAVKNNPSRVCSHKSLQISIDVV